MGVVMHFFKIHHGFCNNPKFNLVSHRAKQPKAIVLGVITSLLEYASMQKSRGSVDGFSTEAYAYDLGMNEDDVITICNALRNIGFILDDSIRNWEEYQTYDRTGAERQRRYRENKKLDTSIVTDVTERNALRNTEEKRVEESRLDNNKDITKVISKKRATQLGDNWDLPQEWGEWADTLGMSEADINFQADKFRDYWIGCGKAKADWQATWRNWIRSHLERKK